MQPQSRYHLVTMPAWARVSRMGRPLSVVSRRAVAWPCSSRRSARRRRMRPRAAAPGRDQSGSAAAALAVAAWTSSSTASGSSARASPLAGSLTVKCRPAELLTHFPPISIPVGGIFSAVFVTALLHEKNQREINPQCLVKYHTIGSHVSKIRLATAIAKMLEAAGTEFCFGYNGHGNWALLDAFVHETSVRTIAARAEDHAVHMADIYWRIKRRAPMAVVTTSVGPGNA